MKNLTLATRTQGDTVVITCEVSLEDFDWTGASCRASLATSRVARDITTFSDISGDTGTTLTLTATSPGRAMIVMTAEPSVTASWPTTTLTLTLVFFREYPEWGPVTSPNFYLPVVPPALTV